MQFSRFVFLVLFTLILSSNDAATQPQRFVVMSAGVASGAIDLEVTKLRNGYIEYKLRDTRTVIRADGKRQDYLRRSTCLADAALRPISIETTVKTGNVTATIKGSVVGGTMYLTRDLGRGRIERWREDCTDAVVDLMLPEVVARSLPEVPKRLFRLQDHKAVASDLHIETGNGGDIIISQAGREFWHVSAEGTLLRYDSPALALSWEPAGPSVPRPSPHVLNAGVEWDAGTAALPTRPDNIRSLRATVLLKSQVGASLAPEDARQSIAPGGSSDGNSVTVTTTRRHLPIESVPLPVFDKTLLPFIKGDSALTLDGEFVRKRALALKAWERNSDIVINALSGAIRREFIPDPFVPLVPAESVARIPRGSSLHASLLFVAVARTVGLPARFVLGVAPVDGRWISKVWVEVWSGHWLPFDASAGEMLTDASHIKLLDAASLSDILDQSQRLKSALTIRIEHVALVDTSEAATLETAIIGSTYTNRTHTCAVTAPGDEWLIEERVLGDEIAVYMNPTMGSAVEFEVLLFKNVWNQSAEDLLGARIKALRVLLDGLTILQRGEVRIANRSAPTIMYSYSKRNGTTGTRMTAAHCMLAIGSSCYLFSFSAPEESFESIRPAMESVLRNFRSLR